jgi:hypothetical protein
MHQHSIGPRLLDRNPQYSQVAYSRKSAGVSITPASCKLGDAVVCSLSAMPQPLSTTSTSTRLAPAPAPRTRIRGLHVQNLVEILSSFQEQEQEQEHVRDCPTLTPQPRLPAILMLIASETALHSWSGIERAMNASHLPNSEHENQSPPTIQQAIFQVQNI